MSAVLDFIEDTVDFVGDTVGDVVDTVFDVVETVFDEVVEPVVEKVGDFIETMADDPIAAIATIAAVATNQLYLLPYISGIKTLADGGSVGDALQAAAITYVAVEVGAGFGSVGSDVGTAIQYGTEIGSQQTAMLAAQELGFPGTASQIGRAAGTALGSTAVTGGDIENAVLGAVIGSSVSAVTSQIDGFNDLPPVVQSMVNSGVAAELRGGDGTAAAVNSALQVGIGIIANSGVTSVASTGALPVSASIEQQVSDITSTLQDFESLSDDVKFATTTAIADSLAAGNGTLEDSLIAADAGINAMNAAILASGGVTQVTEPVSNVDIIQSPLTLASADASTTSDAGNGRLIDVTGTPLYTDSTGAGYVKPPFDYALMPSSLADSSPEVAYYDSILNASLMPDLSIPTGTGDPLVADMSTETANEIMGALPTATVGTAENTDSSMGTLPEITVTDEPEPVETGDTDTDLGPGMTPPMDAAPDVDFDPYLNVPVETGDTDTDLGPGMTPPMGAAPSWSINIPSGALPTAAQQPQQQQQPPSLKPTSGLPKAVTETGALPVAPVATSLTAAPRREVAAMDQLVQLYPNLRDVDSRLLSVLAERSGPPSYYKYGAASRMSTPLMSTSIGSAPSANMPLRSTGSYTVGALDSSSPLSFAQGGNASRYVRGSGDGQSDSIPAMLSDGEYVIDADVVAALGNGSNEAGAKILDRMRENIRTNKRSTAKGKIPPAARSPLSYMKG